VRARPEPNGQTPNPTPAPKATTLAELQTANDRTARNWDLYSAHRRQLTELIAAHGPRRRLCVLGAGNANDLDLAALAARFDELHLADLDATALGRAVRRQAPETRRRVALHAERDLSGLIESLAAWRTRAPDLDALARAAPAAAARVVAGLPGPFDLVVSDCLLSQIAFTCYRALGDGPLLMAALDVALAAHLRALVALTRPGGRCLLVTDVISSDAFPLDRLFPHLDHGALLRRLDQRGRLFSGTSPTLAHTMLEQDPDLACEVEDVSMITPWLWRVAPQHTVLVYALAFARRASVKMPSPIRPL
jgi:hypothetical protein